MPWISLVLYAPPLCWAAGPEASSAPHAPRAGLGRT